MVGRRFYDFIYRVGAPWGGHPREELVELVRSGRVTPYRFPRIVDLGCGEGEDSLFLASQGFDVVGVDFSRRALAIARKRALKRRLEGRVRFVEGDLTATQIPGVEGPFDFLLDSGSIDDLQGADRVAASRTLTRLGRPGARALVWCFYAVRAELPWISFVGPSKLGPGFEPGEMERLYGQGFDIERLDEPPHKGRWAAFLMEKRALTRSS